MTTTRYCGRIRIYVSVLFDDSGYHCTVSDGHGSHVYTCNVGAPASSRLAIDAPEAIDSAAHACLSFAADEDEGLIDGCAMAESGWHITRKRTS